MDAQEASYMKIPYENMLTHLESAKGVRVHDLAQPITPYIYSLRPGQETYHPFSISEGRLPSDLASIVGRLDLTPDLTPPDYRYDTSQWADGDPDRPQYYGADENYNLWSVRRSIESLFNNSSPELQELLARICTTLPPLTRDTIQRAAGTARGVVPTLRRLHAFIALHADDPTKPVDLDSTPALNRRRIKLLGLTNPPSMYDLIHIHEQIKALLATQRYTLDAQHDLITDHTLHNLPKLIEILASEQQQSFLQSLPEHHPLRRALVGTQYAKGTLSNDVRQEMVAASDRIKHDQDLRQKLKMSIIGAFAPAQRGSKNNLMFSRSGLPYAGFTPTADEPL